MEDYDWIQNTDARVWVEKWLETIKNHPEVPNDSESMLGWFANAIMCGYDRGYKDATLSQNTTRL